MVLGTRSRTADSLHRGPGDTRIHQTGYGLTHAAREGDWATVPRAGDRGEPAAVDRTLWVRAANLDGRREVAAIRLVCV